jgi:hypothetical protein
MNNLVSEYITQYRDKITEICSEIETSYRKAGFSGQLISKKDAIDYSLLKDDLSGKYSLQGVWNYASGYKQGMLLLHPDGSFFAEYDVVKPHPTKIKWFVEAITVWGKNESIKSEPRLLPVVE